VGKQMVILFSVLVLSGSPACAQSIEQKLQAFIAATPRPQRVEDFNVIPHLPPLNQGATLFCWSFSTASFLESEMQRLGMAPMRLSVFYPVSYLFMEKAKLYVRTKGQSRFGPGDLFSGVLDVIKEYGTMPAAVYGGDKEEIPSNHADLYRELDQYIASVKATAAWNEERVLKRVQAMLSKYLGKPPTTFTYKGKTFSPKSFFNEVVKLPWNEYVIITSFQYAPFYQFTELRVPDNWKHNSNYFNVPLDVFYNSLKEAVSQGYSVAVDVDISEPSYELTKGVAIIPDFDMPGTAISQEARELRFNNGTTTDDHLAQIVAYKKFGNEDWFLVKDSLHTAWEGDHPGYVFFHASYVKLKVLAFLVHRDGVPAIKKKLLEKSG
jgi:bleomycin hydrolase